MNSAPHGHREPQVLTRLRRLLLGTLLVGTAGMEAELLLIGHVDGLAQLVPVVLLGLGFGTLVWHALLSSAGSVVALRGLMAAFVLSGLIGVGLHYQGNEEFELEMYPSLSGFELAGKTLTGATPVLAPGSMTLIGLVGLGVTYRHPLRRSVVDFSFEQETEG